MNHDLFESVPQGSDGAQDAENLRIAAIADELQRLCQLHETQLGTGNGDATRLEIELREAEAYAKRHALWIPLQKVFSLGIPGPSGNENNTYVATDAIYKVNNLLNSGGVIAYLRRIVMHNKLFPDTAYQFYGFTGFDGRSVQPIVRQMHVADASPATQIMIDTYMAALGFTKAEETGRFVNGAYEVWDILPRNVLVDKEGDMYVVDAEIREI